ncbi:pro-adrenomedullin [Acanthochromis polyacanthus]|uniref:ADM-like n=1 Tax=Acanthochromis polyacanthus TaxID=80966 RepID=A0A3Q1GVF3_9TELE|nr:pro-adrenomedullin [Acanthochromis polyacanthus]
MRLSLHTVICCCVFTAVLPPVKGATGEPSTSLKKRFRVWLQSHMKRDLRNSLVPANEQESDIHVGPRQDRDANALSPPSSFGLNIRHKRSSGCFLPTCSYPSLVDTLNKVNDKRKDIRPPPIKMSSNGYGRRRRSLLDVSQFALQTERLRCCTEAVQQVSRNQSTSPVA